MKKHAYSILNCFFVYRNIKTCIGPLNVSLFMGTSKHALVIMIMMMLQVIYTKIRKKKANLSFSPVVWIRCKVNTWWWCWQCLVVGLANQINKCSVFCWSGCVIFIVSMMILVTCQSMLASFISPPFSLSLLFWVWWVDWMNKLWVVGWLNVQIGIKILL